MIEWIKKWWQRKHLYIIADARDNSVTFSEALFDTIKNGKSECTKVIVFTVDGKYAFTNDHHMEGKDVAMSDIQYNEKYKCIGFECNVPSVNRIFYDYNISASKVKLSVEVRNTQGQDNIFRYFEIVPPSDRMRKQLHKILNND